MDDTCCILKTSDADGLLDHLNGIRPTIKFTMELEKEGSLPFLDTKVTRLADGKLDIIYCLSQKDAHKQVPAL